MTLIQNLITRFLDIKKAINMTPDHVPEMVICPHCKKPVVFDEIVLQEESQIEADMEGFQSSILEYPKEKQFKWWVTPLNVLFICLFIIGIDMSTGPTIGWTGIDWAFWPVIGIIGFFLIAWVLARRPESFWIMGPLSFVLVSLFLFAIDKTYGENSGFLGLDWAQIPILALLTFGFIIPVISKLGYKSLSPEQKFESLIREEK